jgi:stalled ribosome rescue protein Dom34
LRQIKGGRPQPGSRGDEPPREENLQVNHHHVCVWIDHYEARIYGIGLETADKMVVEDHGPHHHIHRKADHVHLGTEAIDADFMEEVALALKNAKAILVAGPGRARFELAGYLNDRHPATAKHIWAIRAMDHPTDGQIVAAARDFFHAQDPMHA